MINQNHCPHCGHCVIFPSFGLEFYVAPCAECQEVALITNFGYVRLDQEIMKGNDEEKKKQYIRDKLIEQLSKVEGGIPEALASLKQNDFVYKLRRADSIEDLM